MLGQRIKQIRKHNKLTQEEFGKRLNVGKSTVSQWENEINEPDGEMLNKICDAFDVTMDYLYGRSDFPHMTEAESKSLRTIKDIRNEIENDQVLDVDGKPFTPEGKEEALRQLDTLIKLRELQK